MLFATIILGVIAALVLMGIFARLVASLVVSELRADYAKHERWRRERAERRRRVEFYATKQPTRAELEDRARQRREEKERSSESARTDAAGTDAQSRGKAAQAHG